MSETCGVCGKKVEYTCTISVEEKSSKAMCTKCMDKIHELALKKIKGESK